jgi:hypothetical protein
VRRGAVEHHEVRGLARLERANAVVPPQDAGRVDRGHGEDVVGAEIVRLVARDAPERAVDQEGDAHRRQDVVALTVAPQAHAHARAPEALEVGHGIQVVDALDRRVRERGSARPEEVDLRASREHGVRRHQMAAEHVQVGQALDRPAPPHRERELDLLAVAGDVDVHRGAVPPGEPRRLPEIRLREVEHGRRVDRGPNPAGPVRGVAAEERLRPREIRLRLHLPRPDRGARRGLRVERGVREVLIGRSSGEAAPEPHLLEGGERHVLVPDDRRALTDCRDARAQELREHQAHGCLPLLRRQRAHGGDIDPGNHRKLPGRQRADERLSAVGVRVDHPGHDDSSRATEHARRLVGAEHRRPRPHRQDVPAGDGDGAVLDHLAVGVHGDHASDDELVDPARASGSRRGVRQRRRPRGPRRVHP